jgi:putative hydrolase of the HAD superfamily
LRRRPKGLLLDYGGTLVEEVAYDPHAGGAALLERASFIPPGITLADVIARARRVTGLVSSRRDELDIETPWPALTRLIYDYLGVRFDAPMAELELAYWKASVTTRPMPGARDALGRLHAAGVRLAVLSNSSFGADVIRFELARHGLADHLAFVMVSADYVVRKPVPLGVEVAAVRLGVATEDVWFVGDRLDTDVAAANAAGATSVWLRPTGHRESPDPDLTVRDWADLVARFEETR